MPFIDLPESMKSKPLLKKVNAPVLIGLICLVVVLLGFAGVRAFSAFSGESFTLSKSEEAASDKSSDAFQQGSSSAGSKGSNSPESQSLAGEGSEGNSSSSASVQGASKLVVYVCGCVKDPGVYEFAEGSRIRDAVEKAGGFTEDAATEALNLASALADEQQVLVPSLEEYQTTGAGASSQQLSSGAAVSSGGSASAGTSQGLVNINTASSAELVDLPGIGDATAQKIIASRESEGPFQSIDDLKRVSGIGDKKFEALRDLICV